LVFIVDPEEVYSDAMDIVDDLLCTIEDREIA
jgi:hypothetical protein